MFQNIELGSERKMNSLTSATLQSGEGTSWLAEKEWYEWSSNLKYEMQQKLAEMKNDILGDISYDIRQDK